MGDHVSWPWLCIYFLFWTSHLFPNKITIFFYSLIKTSQCQNEHRMSGEWCMHDGVYPCPFPSLLQIFFSSQFFFVAIFWTANAITFIAGKKFGILQVRKSVQTSTVRILLLMSIKFGQRSDYHFCGASKFGQWSELYSVEHRNLVNGPNCILLGIEIWSTVRLPFLFGIKIWSAVRIVFCLNPVWKNSGKKSRLL